MSAITSPQATPAAQGSAGTVVTPPATLSHAEVLLLLVCNELERHARIVEEPYFKSPGLQLRELATSFEQVPSREALVLIAREIFSFAGTDRERAKLVCYTLPHLLRLCSLESKRGLLELALKEPRKGLRKRLAYGVVRASSSKEELFSLLSPVKVRALVACDSRKLTELVAKAHVLRTLRRVFIPTAMWQRRFKENNPTNRRVARSKVREIETAARKGLELLEKLDYLSHRPRTKDDTRPLDPARPLNDARISFSAVARAAEKLRTGARPTYGRLREFVNVATRRLSLECTDGIRLLQSHTLPQKDLWKPNLVNRFMEAFHLVPECERLMTPQLREFNLSKIDVAARRNQSGRIWLDYPGELFRWRDQRYEGRAALTRLVLHEVAHSVQMGHEGRISHWNTITGELYSPNNPLIDLKGFCDLSGWRVVDWFDRSAFIDEEAVRIEGRLYPWGRAVTIALPLKPDTHTTRTPQRVVLRRNENFVYCHNVDARFSLNSYALTDPHEDFAEAFTEYVICPDRLIQLAPEKFHYMEIHFRMYRTANDTKRLTAVQQALQALSEGERRG